MLAPSIYNDFVSIYSQYNIAPNYVGKSAYIHSLKPNTKFIFKDCEWIYDGEYICATNFDLGTKSPWWRQTNSKADIKLKVNDKMTIVINDNSIIDENTKFDE